MSKKTDKKKTNKKVKKEEEPAPDLLGKDGDSLKGMIQELRDKMIELQSRRNYVQNERDLLEQFSKGTLQEIEEQKRSLTNKSTEAEVLEQDHRVEVKVYMQKVKHLEYDQRLRTNQVNQEGENNMKIEDDYHHRRLKSMQKNKADMKTQFVKNEEIYQHEIKQSDLQQKKTLKFLKEDYDRKIKFTEEKYEETLIKLRNELELKLKVEIHEIEERKNQHINELIRNHDVAFNELKSYYNEITMENLGLIRTQKQRIEELQASLIVSSKLITEVKAKNKAIEDPLDKSKKLRDDLKYAVRLHGKDQMALTNLRIKLGSLKDKISKLEREQDLIDKRYAKVIQNKKSLEESFERVTDEVKRHSEAKNIVLSRKLSQLSDTLESKEAQLQQLVQKSGLSPDLVSTLCVKIQESIEKKNSLIKDLQYSIHHSSKAYNDAIRVYESKLVAFGVPADELGFQLLDTKTSVIPAGLVSS